MKTILLIDDDNILRKQLDDNIDKEKFVIEHAKDGLDGLKKINDYDFDLIICDIVMPKMDGIKFLKQFRQENTLTPIIMLTGYPDKNTINMVFELGGNDYIIKDKEGLYPPLIQAKIEKALLTSEKIFLQEELERKNHSLLELLAEVMAKQEELKKLKNGVQGLGMEINGGVEHRRIFFFEEKPKLRNFIYRPLAATGAEVVVVNSYQEGMDVVNEEHFDLYFTDLKHIDILDAAYKINPSSQQVIITAKKLEESISEIAKRDYIYHVFFRPEENFYVTSFELLCMVNKLFNPDIFGINKHIRTAGKPFKAHIYNSREKDSLVRKVQKYAANLGMIPRQQKYLAIALDELIMNAVLHGPQIRMEVTPRDEIFLSEHESPQIEYISDGELLGISVRDPFGTLTRKIVINQLKKCGSRGRGKVSMNTKGAGLGIYETVKALNSLIVNVERGKSSEVIGLIKLNPSVAELRKRRCSLHFFQR